MRVRGATLRLAVRGAAGVLAAVVLAAGMLLAGSSAQASVASPRPVVNPYSPAYHHPYRHGVLPTIGRLKQMRRWAASHGAQASSPSNPSDLSFGGGVDSVGVTTGAEQVYLVFWGLQWGTTGTDPSGDATFSNDPQKVAPDLQALFAGLGTGGETWSGVMTQYCEGVAVGAQSCPASNTEHVAYPSGGALAGVWEDTSAKAPHQATAHQIAQEAEAAATHFGKTTTAANRDAQYVIVSPTGTNPDNFPNSGFCAWHDYSADSTMDGGGAVTGPELAFTNLPYLPDVGASCGAFFVNGAAGILDGVNMTEGHEYAETISDQFGGGWTDASGFEAADKCVDISSGQGAAQNITLTTGTFAMQSIWANDFNNGAGGCEISHPVILDPSVTVTNPGSQAGTVGTAVSLQIQASDSAVGLTLTYSASGLPAGLSVSSSSGLISGTPTAVGAYSVTVTVTDGTATGSASFTFTVNPTPCPPGIKANFRWHYTANGNAGGWSGTATQGCPGGFSMGPQAMDGNLQVAPGASLAAGYDFTLPGNKSSLTMTVSAARVTFTVGCVSGAAPSASTLRVAMSAQTYQITNDQWYPSGDQSSPLVYQGSVTVPDLCGGGKISLARGGTFTATLG